MLQDGRDTKSTATCDAFGNGVRKEVPVKAVGVPVLIKNSLKHRLERLLEELLDQNGLELLTDSRYLLLFGRMLGMSHLHKHGGIHPYVLTSFCSVRFHFQSIS